MTNHGAETDRFLKIGVRFGGAEYEKGLRLRIGSARGDVTLCVTCH